MSDRCPIHQSFDNTCPVCLEWWARNGVNHINWQDVPAFYESTWPQYRKVKIVDGEEFFEHLDGTETDDTAIVKFDHSEEYKKFRERVMLEAMKESPK